MYKLPAQVFLNKENVQVFFKYKKNFISAQLSCTLDNTEIDFLSFWKLAYDESTNIVEEFKENVKRELKSDFTLDQSVDK